MGKIKDKAKKVVRSSGRGVYKVSKNSVHTAKKVGKKTIHTAKRASNTRVAKTTKRHTKEVHHRFLTTPHLNLMDRSRVYSWWHSWNIKKLHHKQIHYGILVVYVILSGIFVTREISKIFAADLMQAWSFSSPTDYEISNGVEIIDNSARLKPQEYTSDSNTVGLYHFNESGGTNSADSSANNNLLSLRNGLDFISTNMRNGINLNGLNKYATAGDSPSLSMTGQQTVEAWIKPNSTFDVNASQSQTILDKGSYRLGLDRTNGKAFYEIQDNSNPTWAKRLGNGMAGSWDNSMTDVLSMVDDGTDIYIGTGGSATSDAEVWKYDGTVWSKIGGDGVNNSWTEGKHTGIRTMLVFQGNLIVGTGSSYQANEVWKCSLANNCATWEKIGSKGNGISLNYTYSIESMAVYNNELYIGTSGSINSANIYKYNGGSSWTHVAGNSVNSSWPNAGYNILASMYSDGTYLYAGLAGVTNDAEVWRYNGTSWTKIGGDGINNSWNNNYEGVRSIIGLGNKLYIGLGDQGNDADVYYWDGTTWTNTNIAKSANYTTISSLTTDGTNIYASRTGLQNNKDYTGNVLRYNGDSWVVIGGGNPAPGSWEYALRVPKILWANNSLYASLFDPATMNYAVIWKLNGSSWSKIGGTGINQSWYATGAQYIRASTKHSGKLYFGLGQSYSALIYEYDGTTASIIAGNGINNSWPNDTNHSSIYNLVSHKGQLYASVAGGNGYTEVWRYNNTTWEKIGGGNASYNGSWGGAYSAYGTKGMTSWKGDLYTIVENSIRGFDVWKWNGATWASATPFGWPSSLRNAMGLTIFQEKLCTAGGGESSYEALLVCWDGVGPWTIVGGNGSGDSWDNIIGATMGVSVYDNKLVVAINDNNNLIVKTWDGTTWVNIGGEGLNNSWTNGDYAKSGPLYFVTYNNALYMSTHSGSGIWRWDGTTWTQVAGIGTPNWPTVNAIESLNVYKGKLYVSMTGQPQVYSYGNNAYIESNITTIDNNWHHIAGRFDGSNMSLIIDGTVDSSKTASASGAVTTAKLVIGAGIGGTQISEGIPYFDGQIDEVRISNIARNDLISRPFSNEKQTITLGTKILSSGVKSWDGFSTNETTEGGDIKYRLSNDDGLSWQYWDGDSWEISSDLQNSNYANIINDNISSLPVTFSGIRWQAISQGNGHQRVQLNNVGITAQSDNTKPSNVSNIKMYRSNGGDEITQDGWTNTSTPYITWDASTDSDAGILGYCLYLGEDLSANIATSKGILGNGPLDSGGHCQFATVTNSIDLQTANYLSTLLTSSNNTKYIHIKAIDRAGNISQDNATFSFKFDNTLPKNPGFITAPAQFIANKNITFTWPISGQFAPNDDHSGLAGLQYRIGQNGSWFGDGTSGAGRLDNDGEYTTREDPDFPNILEGNNTIYFRTWDQAGNVSTTYATGAIKLNTMSPGSPINVTANPAINTNNNFSFSWNPPELYTGSVNALTYCYTVNTLPTENTCIYTNPGVTQLPAGAFATQPGENTLYVVAKDEAGNINFATHASTTFTANTSAPGISQNIDIADVSVKSTSTWRLALTWEAPGVVGAGVASYRVYRSTDNINFSQVASTSGTSHVDSGLTTTKYFYKVRACDSANNCGADTPVVSKIPTGKFTDPPLITAQPDVQNISTKKATIKWSTDRTSDSKISIGTSPDSYDPYQIASQNQVTDHKVDLTGLNPGTTYFAKAVWTDEDGNTGKSSEFSFKTEPAPSTQEVSVTKVGLSTAQIKFTSISAAKIVIQYGKSDGFGGIKEISTSLSKSTYDTELTGLDDGTKYFYRLNTFDSEGNEYIGSTVLTFTTPPRPKISNLYFQPVEGEPTSTQKITWNTNVPTTSLVRLSSTSIPAKEYTEPGMKTEHEIIIHDLIDDTEYSLVAESRDSGGNLVVSDTQNLKTALDTRPPKISDISIETTVKGTGAEARGQVVVSWKTDEPATSQVAYAEGSQARVFNNKTPKDDSLSTEHIVIVSDLPTSRVYSVRPLSEDRGQNLSEGKISSAIIGRASDSVLTVVLNSMKRIFGF